jgi:hypothetical protein
MKPGWGLFAGVVAASGQEDAQMEPDPIERTKAMSFGEAIQTVFRKYAEFTGPPPVPSSGGGRSSTFSWWARSTSST